MNWDPESIKNMLLLLAGLMVIAAAIFMIGKARNGEVREAFGVSAIIFIAALVIAVGSHLEEVGNFLFNVIF